jgi:hypothetical protein
MPKLTFFPLGNADCCLVDLDGGEKLLFDYADVRDPTNASDLRIDLPQALRDQLRAAGRYFFDVVAFTHADDDHVCGMSAFFHLEHAATYQGADRVKIRELWVPAAVIVEEGLEDDARVLQAEARYRLRIGAGIRIFSRPEALKTWCDDHGVPWQERHDLFTDAGTLVDGFTKAAQGVEFFVHSPFAERVDGELIDRNGCSLVLQATFAVAGDETRVILSADTTWKDFVPMVKVTQLKGNHDRLKWDLFKLPHHCSYLSLGPEKGSDATAPVEEVRWLFEDQGTDGGIVVSTSDPIPTVDSDQPPHRQAAAYYRRRVAGDEFVVTMEHPRPSRPEPLVILIGRSGARVEKRNPASGFALASQAAHRAG